VPGVAGGGDGRGRGRRGGDRPGGRLRPLVGGGHQEGGVGGRRAGPRMVAVRRDTRRLSDPAKWSEEMVFTAVPLTCLTSVRA
jgi:hypothetical protein